MRHKSRGDTGTRKTGKSRVGARRKRQRRRLEARSPKTLKNRRKAQHECGSPPRDWRLSCQLSAVSPQLFCYAARCWGASQASRAQQRLYFWPEPQGHWAFLAGCGGALTVLQCEPREAVSYQRSALSFFAMRLVVGVFPRSALCSSDCIFGPNRRGIGRFGPVSGAL